MLILTQDRVSGLVSEKTPLSSYGPGNMLDDSNRNSWVSSSNTDSLVVNCNSQVNAIFLGRYQADNLYISYFSRDLLSQITSTGEMSIGYDLLISKVEISPLANGRFEVTLTVDSSEKVNVNDVIEVTGIVSSGKDPARNLSALSGTGYPARTDPGNSSVCGFQKVTKVQTAQSLSSLNKNGQTVLDAARPDSLQTLSYEVVVDPGVVEYQLNTLSPTPTPNGWTVNNSYTGVTQDEGSETNGTGATFNISTDSSGIPTLTITSYGSGYGNGDKIKITDPEPGNNNVLEVTVQLSGNVFNGINNLHCAGGSGGSVTVDLVDPADNIYEYTVTFGSSFLFGATDRTVNSSENPFVVGQQFYMTGLNSVNLGTDYLAGNHVITESNSADKTIKFRHHHAVEPVLDQGNPYFSLSTSVFFDGGTLLHEVGNLTIPSLTLFNNTDAVRVKDTGIAQVNINAIGDEDALSYTDHLGNKIVEGSLRKDFTKASVKDQYKFSYLTNRYYPPPSNVPAGHGQQVTSGVVQKYVTDTNDTQVTRDGEGSYIHRARLSTRTQTSLSNFVTGDLVLIKSTYIPLPRQSHPSEIQLDYESVLNRNAANTFNEWMLESVVTEGPTIQVDGFRYNAVTPTNSDEAGKLTLKLSSASHGLEVGDYIYGTLPTELMYGGDIEVAGFSANNSTTMTTTGTTNNLYAGMTLTGSGIPSNCEITQIVDTTNIIVSKTVTTTNTPVTFEHPDVARDDADIAFNRVLRVVDVDAERIGVYAPNFGNNVDLTRVTEADFQTGSGTNTQLLVHSSPVTGRFVQKVRGGKGRFVRPITGNLTQEQRLMTHLLWNSSDSVVTYIVGSEEIEVPSGTAKAIFANDHGLVNNDKIVLFGIASHPHAQYMVNLQDSYLVTYSTGNTVTFNIPVASSSEVVGQVISNGSTTMSVVTDGDHGFAAGETIDLYNSITTTYNGTYVIDSVTTANSFNVTIDTAPTQDISLSNQSPAPKVTGGVHYRNGVVFRESGNNTNSISALENVSCVRTMSVEAAESTFERPISVGNILYIDGLEESNSIYNTDQAKTPFVNDAGTSSGYNSGAVNSEQGYFIGESYSTTGQIERVIGDGTAFENVHLTKAVGKLGVPIEFTKLFHGLLTGILRAGVSQEFPNPQQGLSNSFKDYSVRKELATGSYYFLNRESAKQFGGRIVGSPDEIDKFVDFGQDQMAEPFAVLIVSGTGTEIKKLRLRAAVYGYFTQLPTANYQNKLATLKNANFNIKEVL